MGLQKKEGDDTGMQTRVWGPMGWVFLHCIAQNYPWEPDQQKKTEYLQFFKLVGSVLPCRYCRESYQTFLQESDTQLNESVMENRRTLTTWLFKIHNKVNKKLSIKDNPTLQQVWDKYESFRSKCTKSPQIIEKLKKGCTDPLKGLRKRCVYTIVSTDSEGIPIEKPRFTFGKQTKQTKQTKQKGKKNKLKLISIKKSNRAGKKLMATFETGNQRKKVIHFGQQGAGDYTKHHDKERRKRYITRHRKDLGTGNPARAGYLSMFVLWNKPSLQASIRDYKRRVNIYNSTGKFPSKIN
jgi:hypothetical protein